MCLGPDRADRSATAVEKVTQRSGLLSRRAQSDSLFALGCGGREGPSTKHGLCDLKGVLLRAQELSDPHLFLSK